MKKKKIVAIIIIIVGILCIGAGIVFLVMNSDSSLSQEERIKIALEIIKEETEYTEEDLTFQEINENNYCVFLINEQENDWQTRSIAVNIDDGTYGYIVSDSIGLTG